MHGRRGSGRVDRWGCSISVLPNNVVITTVVVHPFTRQSRTRYRVTRSCKYDLLNAYA